MIEKTEKKDFDDENTLHLMREKVKRLETEEKSLLMDIAGRQTTLKLTTERKEKAIDKLIKYEKDFNIMENQRKEIFSIIKNLESGGINKSVCLNELKEICISKGLTESEINYQLGRFLEKNYIILLPENKIQILKNRIYNGKGYWE